MAGMKHRHYMDEGSLSRETPYVDTMRDLALQYSAMASKHLQSYIDQAALKHGNDSLHPTYLPDSSLPFLLFAVRSRNFSFRIIR